MARKPNYKFERLERQRAKAAKKAARLEAKKERAEKRQAENAGLVLVDDGSAGSPGEPPGQPQEDGDPNRPQEDGDPNR